MDNDTANFFNSIRYLYELDSIEVREELRKSKSLIVPISGNWSWCATLLLELHRQGFHVSEDKMEEHFNSRYELTDHFHSLSALLEVCGDEFLFAHNRVFSKFAIMLNQLVLHDSEFPPTRQEVVQFYERDAMPLMELLRELIIGSLPTFETSAMPSTIAAEKGNGVLKKRDAVDQMFERLKPLELEDEKYQARSYCERRFENDWAEKNAKYRDFYSRGQITNMATWNLYLSNFVNTLRGKVEDSIE